MQINDLRGKRLLMLEGTILAKRIIEKAHNLGIYVVIANWYSVEDAPAKTFADKEYTVNIFDIPAMMEIIKKEKIDGIFTAYTDSHLHIYERLCREANLPCFTAEGLCDIMVDKALFKDACKKAKLPIIDEYDAQKILEDNEYAKIIEYPVIVKPVDNSGARGISVCHSEETLKTAVLRGLEFSKSKKVIVEKYLRGEYCLADFMIQDGKAYFCASSDKPANDDNKDNVNLPGAYIFPSKSNELIKQTLCKNVQEFVKNIGYKNGLLCFELINMNDRIYIIEAQFRYGAKFQEEFIKQECGIDQVEMLLRHALTGKLAGYNLQELNDNDFKNSYALLNILLSEGKIAKLPKEDEVLQMPFVDVYIPRKKEGEVIVPDGSMVQCFGKTAFSAPSRKELLNALKYFQSHLCIFDTENRNMVINSLEENYS